MIIAIALCFVFAFAANVAADDEPQSLAPDEKVARLIKSGGYQPTRTWGDGPAWLKDDPEKYTSAVEAHLSLPREPAGKAEADERQRVWRDFRAAFSLVQFLKPDDGVRIAVEAYVEATILERKALRRLKLEPESVTAADLKEQDDATYQYVMRLGEVKGLALEELSVRTSDALVEYVWFTFGYCEGLAPQHQMLSYFHASGSADALLRVLENGPWENPNISAIARGYLTEMELTKDQKARFDKLSADKAE